LNGREKYLENKIKIATIIGARPQFVKAACISRIIRTKYADKIEETVIHTGQHYDHGMSGVFFEELDIPEPEYNLGISSLSHGAMVGRMIEKLEQLFIKLKPDIVLLYGDTNSTLAGAISAVKLHIPAAHVEAGLRSFNNKMPEEINRILTDRISSLLFAPTETAVNNLKAEGFDNFSSKIVLSGDVMYDSYLFNKKRMKKPEIGLPGKFILATLHRPETTNDPEILKNCISAFRNSPLPVVLALHPGTQEKLKKYKIQISDGSLIIIPPVSYREMLYLLYKCRLVATDSGGLQKEAFWAGKHCVTLRNESEWVELEKNGFNAVSGYDLKTILKNMNNMLKKKPFNPADHDFYGKGKASEMIVKELLKFVKSERKNR